MRQWQRAFLARHLYPRETAAMFSVSAFLSSRFSSGCSAEFETTVGCCEVVFFGVIRNKHQFYALLIFRLFNSRIAIKLTVLVCRADFNLTGFLIYLFCYFYIYFVMLKNGNVPLRKHYFLSSLRWALNVDVVPRMRSRGHSRGDSVTGNDPELSGSAEKLSRLSDLSSLFGDKLGFICLSGLHCCFSDN